MATRADKVIAFIERYCFVPEGTRVGQPIELAPFQKRFINAIYDNEKDTRRAYLSLGRKNGKTALIACLLLAHLVGPEAQPNTQIISGARSRDQASLVFNHAVKIVRLSPQLESIVQIKTSQKTLIGLPRSVEYKAIAAEGSTALGLSPVLAILDEVGQVQGPQDDFVDAITTSQGAHDRPLLIAISTQAASDTDLFSVWLDDAAVSQDSRIVSHVYEADEEAALDDEQAWRAANPALGIFRSKDDVREQAERAMRMPTSEASFRNLILNQRVDRTASLVSKDVWKACGRKPLPLDPERPCFAGLDLSARTDLTALVVVQKVEDVWQVHPFFWTPRDTLFDRAKRDNAPYTTWVDQGHMRATPGATVDLEFVASDMAEMLGHLNVAALFYDRWRMHALLAELERIGLELPVEDHGQGFKDMSGSIDALEAELLNKRLAHGLHPVLTMCVMDSKVKQDPAGNRKLDKQKSNRRIDGAVALAMCFKQTTRARPEAANDHDLDDFLASPLFG